MERHGGTMKISMGSSRAGTGRHQLSLKFAMVVTTITLLMATLGVPKAQGQGVTIDPAAQEFVASMRAGEPAPFAGTLFSTAAAARLLADMELRSESCEVETSRRLRILEADMQLRVDTEIARREALQYRHDQMIEVRDGQIEFLSARLRSPEWHESGEFWFAMGAIAGIAVTVVSAYTLSLIAP